MKKRVIKLKESDLERLVKKIIKEEKSHLKEMGDLTGEHPIFGNLNFNNLSPGQLEMVAQYFSGKKPTYKTDDGDLEHGTFDAEDEEYMYRVKNVKPRWMDESEEGSDKKWIQGAIGKEGSLRKKMGAHKGENISPEKMSKKLSTLRKKDKDPDKEGIQGLSKNDLSTYRQIMLAKRLKKYKS